MEVFMEQATAASWRLTRALSASLGLPPDGLDATFGTDPHVQMKIARQGLSVALALALALAPGGATLNPKP